MALIDPGKLRKIEWSESVQRFLLGACVSALAAVAGKLLGDRIGGAMLAFPAVLPASITLASKKDGREAAVEHERGALFGGAGLVAFALTLGLTAAPLRAGAIAAALAVWMLVGLGGFFVLHDRHGRPRGAATGRPQGAD